MSTSSLIYLKTEENSSSFYYGFKNCFYRHYDGMPEVTGHDIARLEVTKRDPNGWRKR